MVNSISFPNFGIDLELGETVKIFGFDIYWYGIIIAFGMAVAVGTAFWEFHKKGLKSDDLVDFIIFAIPLGILGARLYYVIFSWDYYGRYPGEIYKIWNGGLAIYGGVIGAVLTVIVYCRIKKLSVLHYLDLAAMGFLIGQSVGRWGNFVNGEAHGALCSSDCILGMHINGKGPFHPTFLYESVLCAVGFLLIHFLAKKFNCTGFRANAYLIWYGASRFFVEGLRTDSLYIPGTEIRVSQGLSLLMLLCGVAVMAAAYIKKYRKNNNLHLT